MNNMNSLPSISFPWAKILLLVLGMFLLVDASANSWSPLNQWMECEWVDVEEGEQESEEEEVEDEGKEECPPRSGNLFKTYGLHPANSNGIAFSMCFGLAFSPPTPPPEH